MARLSFGQITQQVIQMPGLAKRCKVDSQNTLELTVSKKLPFTCGIRKVSFVPFTGNKIRTNIEKSQRAHTPLRSSHFSIIMFCWDIIVFVGYWRTTNGLSPFHGQIIGLLDYVELYYQVFKCMKTWAVLNVWGKVRLNLMVVLIMSLRLEMVFRK